MRPARRWWWRWLWRGARAAAGGAVVVRLARGATRRPPVVPEDDPLDAVRTGVTVSVVIPARDEAGRIGRLLAALAVEPTRHELIVVDDESTDDTAAVAAAAGATVVAGRPPPAGWVGKPWALQQGLDAATGEWVVALDADTVPAPGLLAAAVRRAEADGWDLLSLAARFECDQPLQRMLHPALLTTLVYRFGPPGAAAVPAPARILANGQCLVFRAAALRAAGGFSGAAGHLTDDVALARHLARAGWRVGFLDGTPALRVRMHADAAATWRDWGRSLPLPDVTGPGWMAADLAVVWLAQALPLVRLATGRADLVDRVLLLVRGATLVATRPAYVEPGAAYWWSPLADLAAAVRLTEAALRPERTWRGRTYPAARP